MLRQVVSPFYSLVASDWVKAAGDMAGFVAAAGRPLHRVSLAVPISLTVDFEVDRLSPCENGRCDGGWPCVNTAEQTKRKEPATVHPLIESARLRGWFSCSPSTFGI